MAYDSNNIFAKILRGEIPCNQVLATEHALAFHDVSPQAPVHVLVIPKGEYVSAQDFGQNAPAELVAGFWKAVSDTARELGLVNAGYRLIANTGTDGGQEVPHFHVHILGGKKLGKMVAG